MTNNNDVILAFEQVKRAVHDLHEDHTRTKFRINEIEAEIAALHKMRPPFEDFKDGILELVGRAGQRYKDEYIKPQLISFATGGLSGSRQANNSEDFGKPLTLAELDGAINGTVHPESRAQLITPEKHQFDDLAFYALFGEQVKAMFDSVLSDMGPQDFGYHHLTTDQIGPSRAEMRARENILRNELKELHAHGREVHAKIMQLESNWQAPPEPIATNG